MASVIRLSISLDSLDSIPTRNPNSKPHLHSSKPTLPTPNKSQIKTNLKFSNASFRALTNKQDWKAAEKLVREMILASDSSEPLTYHAFNTLIYACSKRGLVKLGSKWFKIMLDCSVKPNTATFGMLMRLYQKSWNVKEAEFAMSEMKRFGIVCESAYSSMITIYTRLGLYEKAESVIELMKSEVIVLNVENWLVILNAYCQQGKMVEAERVLVTMEEEAGFCINNIVVYNTMITGYGKASNMDGAESVFSSLGLRGIEPDETSYRSMIEGWGRAGNYEKARWYYDELKRLGFKLNSSNLFTMIKLQANEGDIEGVVGTVDDMVRCGCHYSSIIGTLVSVYERAGKVHELPRLLKGSFYRYILVNQSCCSTVVMAYVKNKLVDDTLRVLSDKKWKDSRYEDNLYHLLICSCRDEGLLEDAVGIYKQMTESDDNEKKLNKHIVCTMIDIYSVMGRFKDAEMLYLKLKKSSSSNSLDIIAFSIVVRMYVRAGSLKDACSVLDDIDKRRDIIPDIFLLRDMLRIYQRCNMVDKLEKVYSKISKDRVNWDQEVYNCVLNCCAQALPVDELSRLFDEMLQRGFVPNTISYCSMIEGWGRAGNYEKARWYYDELKRSGFKPNSSNFFTMIKLQANEGDFEGAVGTVDDMVRCGCHYSSIIGTLVSVYERAGKVHELPRLLKGSFYRYILVNQSCCSTVVMAYVKNKLVDDALRVLSDKKWKDSRYEDNLYHLLICSCRDDGLLEDAIGIYNQMTESDDNEKKLNKHIVCTMIDIYSVMGRFKDAEMLYFKLKKSSSSNSLDIIAFSIVVKMYVRAGSLKDACSVLDDIDKRPDIVPDMFLLRDMLRIYQRCNMMDKLEKVYSKISKDRVNWDQEVYNCVLNCCAQALPVDELSRLFDEMLQRGFVPNTITYNVMLNVFGKAKLFKKVGRLYSMAKKQGLVDVITYNTIIATYGKNKDFSNMSRTVHNMQFDGFSVSLEAYNSMLDAYGKDGQMDAFRSVLQMMKVSNCTSDLYTYNTVINIYGEQGWIEEVADVLAELNACGLQPDLCSYNTLIKVYGIAGMVEESVNVIKEMRKNGIEPDQKTYTTLIDALKRNDKFLEAVKWSLWMKQMKL